MRSFFLFALFFFIVGPVAAQSDVKRNIIYHNLGKDSVALSLTDNYYLTEDTCAAIVRYAHFNFHTKTFTGKFRDVVKGAANVVLAEGSYNSSGKKEGAFTVYYPNGSLYAKGNYKNNSFDGKWQLFYEDGKPQLVFEDSRDGYKIWDAWLPDGTHTVENGKGEFTVDGKASFWKGAILNGRPDGNWKLYDTQSDRIFATEYFEHGKFQDGTSDYSRYSGKTLITLVYTYFTFKNAENMVPSFQVCPEALGDDASGQHMAANAHFAHGSDTFMEDLQRAVSTYFNSITYLRDNSRNFKIEGEISPEGKFSNMHSGAEMGRGILYQLKLLPALTPATIDGKPVAQKFVMSFIFKDGFYSFNYNLLPL